MATPPVVKVVPERSVFLICDVQTRFRPAVANFDKVVMTTNKMLKIAKVIGVPIIVTEQNPLALGDTVPEIDLQNLGPLHLGTLEKSLFSMVTPELEGLLRHHNFKSVIIMGIEVMTFTSSRMASQARTKKKFPSRWKECAKPVL
ncbi:hypothetical protein PHLCEN_2v1283 [Hermanssonia centrifuga]|uniref:Isochorismatase-like domain-containing protein n=1 Tax=Hermanssonia centrifuga TaxID=98765 RepID=A0A2R6S3M4_9APHY|nr:hypothetical protein PHLCEN_2v1283 [Hermanssonia centrifuga]